MKFYKNLHSVIHNFGNKCHSVLIYIRKTFIKQQKNYDECIPTIDHKGFGEFAP